VPYAKPVVLGAHAASESPVNVTWGSVLRPAHGRDFYSAGIVTHSNKWAIVSCVRSIEGEDGDGGLRLEPHAVRPAPTQ
jgi:hypothetical protein